MHVAILLYALILGRRGHCIFYENSVMKQNEPVTTNVLLNKIIAVLGKHEYKKPIGVDTLALTLGLKPSEILPMVEELEQRGFIQRQIPATNSRRATSMGTVTLI